MDLESALVVNVCCAFLNLDIYGRNAKFFYGIFFLNPRGTGTENPSKPRRNVNRMLDIRHFYRESVEAAKLEFVKNLHDASPINHVERIPAPGIKR